MNKNKLHYFLILILVLAVAVGFGILSASASESDSSDPLQDYRDQQAELEADLDVRLERNGTPLRLEEKASKRDVAASEARMLRAVENHRMNSNPGEIAHKNYIRINNTDLSPGAVAEMVAVEFGVQHSNKG